MKEKKSRTFTEEARLFEAISCGDVRLIAETINEKEDTVAHLPTIPLSL